ncbi:PucR family transcriptional regulator [Nocardia sp. NPDC056100]|uniref:PucR family transcriptional regulator n=1 Tax=Nocardia sp. NPDC056100 TaxID=3345712 RepID=UPI0035D83C2D
MRFGPAAAPGTDGPAIAEDANYADLGTVTRTCLELTASMLDGRDLPDKIERLGSFVAQWAQDGVPIDTIHQSIHDGLELGLDRVVSTMTIAPEAGGRATEARLDKALANCENLARATKLIIEMLDRTTATVSAAYVREARTAVTEHNIAVATLTSALLAGHPFSTIARECGIEVAEFYHVFVLSLQPSAEATSALDGTQAGRRMVHRIQEELAGGTAGSALSLLSVDGGTVLIPRDVMDSEAAEELIGSLSRTVEAAITAVATLAAPEQIPTAAAQAHELLTMAGKLGWAARLYRFDDLALEYQLSREGFGRDVLGSLLDPLDTHPELLRTLERHIGTNLNRQRTARLLHVHSNTVDYRLKRIGQLTGYDPTQATGLWHLRAALIARACDPL